MLKVRKAEPSEAEAVLNFYHTLIDKMESNPFRPTWTKGVYPLLEDLTASISAGSLLVAESDGKIVGAAILTDIADSAYSTVNWNTSVTNAAVIHLVAVDPDRHREGIAQRLLASLCDLALERGAEAIRLDTLPNNLPGRRLYEKFGFQYCGDKELYYPSAGTQPFSMYEYVLKQ